MTKSPEYLEESSIKKFWNDGFVILRNVLDPDYVLSMEEPISKVIDEDAVSYTHLRAHET